MFYDRFQELCLAKGVKPGRACVEMGLSRSLSAKWKNSGTEKPSADVLEKMSIYFDLSINEILGTGTQKTTPALTKKDERDIARELERLRESLESGDTLMFDGDPMSDEARESILQAMELGVRAAKLKSKEKFTPKKYRKD